MDDNLINQLSVYTIITREEEIVLFQYSDEKLRKKIDILRKDKSLWSKREKSEVQGFKLTNGILYKTVTTDDVTRDLYVVPQHMRKSLVIRFHDMAGHIGRERVMKKMAEHYYFPNMRKYMENHVKMCLECILSKRQVGKQPGFLHPIPPGRRSFQICHLDHLGHFPTIRRGNKYLLVLKDNLTKFVQLQAVKTTHVGPVIRKLDEFIDKYGAPERFFSDRGTCFTSGKFKEFRETHGIQHVLNSSRHPQANGLVERINSVIIPMLQCTTGTVDETEWDKYVRKIEFDINTSVNKSTGKTPFELLYGYIPRREGRTRWLTVDTESYRLPEELREELRTHIEEAQRKYKGIYDKHGFRSINYNIGDIVYMKTAPKATGTSTKLQPRYNGPYTIVEVLPHDTYRITNLHESKGKYSTTAYVSQLKIWRCCPSDSSKEDEPEPKLTEMR